MTFTEEMYITMYQSNTDLTETRGSQGADCMTSSTCLGKDG